MTYNFDQILDRRGTHATKWDVGEGELPMWIADMDFPTAPEIQAAIQARAAHGIYGYTDIPEAWYDAICGWWGNRHGFRMEREWLLFSTGVVPTISSVVRKLTTPGENVLTMTPVYDIFSTPSRTTAAGCWSARSTTTMASMKSTGRTWSGNWRTPRPP